eukprot:TRINITY_DN4449_c0_g1_i3.p1 TRINITY_DN4449_c0_g1~~TRINITY_DN4449_c0_g1_i3.p1  ORF type:complete len:195 (+),score=11.38 TRINITY_DN4449_c0_g1_i3:69-587(+)
MTVAPGSMSSGEFSAVLNSGTSQSLFQVRVASLVNASYTNVLIVSYTPSTRKIVFLFTTSETNPAPMDADELADRMTALYTSSKTAVQAALGVTGFSPPYTPPAPSSGPSTGLIIGAALGGLVAVILIAVVMNVLVRGRRRESGGETFVSMNTQMNDLELHLNADDYRESHV